MVRSAVLIVGPLVCLRFVLSSAGTGVFVVSRALLVGSLTVRLPVLVFEVTGCTVVFVLRFLHGFVIRNVVRVFASVVGSDVLPAVGSVFVCSFCLLFLGRLILSDV